MRLIVMAVQAAVIGWITIGVAMETNNPGTTFGAFIAVTGLVWFFGAAWANAVDWARVVRRFGFREAALREDGPLFLLVWTLALLVGVAGIVGVAVAADGSAAWYWATAGFVLVFCGFAFVGALAAFLLAPLLTRPIQALVKFTCPLPRDAQQLDSETLSGGGNAVFLGEPAKDARRIPVRK